VLWGHAQVAFRSDSLLPRDHSKSYPTNKRAKSYAGISLGFILAGCLAYFEQNPADVERLASDFIELSTRQSLAQWLAGGELYRGWARSASGYRAEGIASIEGAIRSYRVIGSMQVMPFSASPLFCVGSWS
jgi:hypothetical protein